MPNWVKNEVNIDCGSPERAKEIYEQLTQPYVYYTRTKEYDTLGCVRRCESNGFTFHNIITPGLDRMLSEEWDKSDSWYNWNIENWGTKWDACDVYASLCGNKVEFSFDTAWSEPEEVLRSLSLLFPDVIVNNDWTEEQGFGESVSYENGVRCVDDAWDVPEYEEEEEKQNE